MYSLYQGRDLNRTVQTQNTTYLQTQNTTYFVFVLFYLDLALDKVNTCETSGYLRILTTNEYF